MKVLIIQDVHNQISTVDKIISLVEHDKIIFTGDFFDSHWGDQVPLAKATAAWVKEKLADPKNVLMFGNHDVSYMFPKNFYASCSGFDSLKAEAINDILGSDFAKLRPFHFENGILFSHAGVTRQLVGFVTDHREKWTVDEFIADLYVKTDEAVEKFKINHPHPLFGVGWDRGGRDNHGGITWQDQSMHEPIDGIPQIFGHSIRDVPEFVFMNAKGSKSANGAPLKAHKFRATIELTPEVLKNHLKTKAWSLDGDTALNNFLVMDTEANTITVYKLIKDGVKKIEDLTAKEVYSFEITVKKHETQI